MTPDEFVDLCVQCGYASATAARRYAKNKSNLTEDDFVEINRLSQAAADKIEDEHNPYAKRSYYEGVKTTKKVKED